MKIEEAKQILDAYISPNGVGFPDVKEAIRTLYDDCEILTKEAYSDLCLRASRAEQEEITLEQAINRLYELGWLQEHDRILAESNGHCEFVNLPPYAKEECADAISRQALRDKLNERHDFYIKAWGGSFENMPIEDKARVDEISACIAEVVNAPSVKPKRETGRWVPVGYDGYWDGDPVIDTWECSECGYEHHGEDTTNYCPNCGLRMNEYKEAE